jgi:hypothetical protein
MKKIYFLLLSSLIITNAFCQSPESISYQAVIRDAANNLLTNQTVGTQISILQGSENGSTVYVEEHTTSTNDNGLISIQIGAGDIVSGSLSNIDWASDSYFIKTETDITGGNNYTISGTSELSSVPFAFHANIADSILGGVSFTEVDGSITNELQTLSIDNDSLMISSGNKIQIDASNSNELQTLSLDNDSLMISSGNKIQIDASNSNELQSLSISIDNDSLMISSGNKINIGKLNYFWKSTNGSSIGFDTTLIIRANSTNFYSGIINKRESTGNQELQGIFNEMKSTSTNSNYIIGAKNMVSGEGSGVHIGSFSSGGLAVNYNMGAGARYGVHGMATDTLSSISYNSAVYGFAS